MAFQVNGINIPATIYNDGVYTPPKRADLGDNAQGDVIDGRVKLVTWAWSIMSQTDYEWWRVTALASNLSIRCAARLPNEAWTETAYTTVVFKRLRNEGVSAAYYRNVAIDIEILA